MFIIHIRIGRIALEFINNLTLEIQSFLQKIKNSNLDSSYILSFNYIVIQYYTEFE